jgi:hypothetical protein
MREETLHFMREAASASRLGTGSNGLNGLPLEFKAIARIQCQRQPSTFRGASPLDA